MPRAKLWFFEVSEDKRIYVKHGGNLLKKYGSVLKIKLAQEEDKQKDHIKVVFSSSDKPRLLSLDAFSWDSNDFSHQFRGCQTPAGFVARWEQRISGQLQESGVLNQSTNLKDTAGAEQAVTQSAESSPSISPSQSVRDKRKRQNVPTPLVPASKQARLEVTSETLGSGNFEEEEMDKIIRTLFIGYFMLPVRSLQEPPAELLVRDRNPQMVSLLKDEMLSNPFGDVQPILCIAQLKDNEVFDSKLKEAYHYYTIGGNHSRQALQELLTEEVHLKNNRQYTHRLCAVYKPMENQLARRLASKHNRAAAYCHEMSTWDWIVQCRKLLYEMSNTSPEEEPPEKPEGWKKACASILALTVGQLDERMIFFLSSLPKNTFAVVSSIFKLYSEGRLKDQAVPRSKKGVKSFPDLKGSTFKPFRGIEPKEVHHLMSELCERKISLKEAGVLCQDMKQLQKIQQSFMKITNCETWPAAQGRFPQFTTAGKLEPFKKLNFTTSTVPEQFMRFCQEALTSGESSEPVNDTSESDMQDNTFWVNNNLASGLLWKIESANINPDAIQAVFSGSKHKFSGFQLSIFDVQIGKECGTVDCKQLVLIVRALNYHAGMQNFTIVFITDLKELNKTASELIDTGDSTQIAVCGLQPRHKGKARDSLDETSVGAVVLRFGNAALLSQYHTNFFCHEMDCPVLDDATGKVVNKFQKPLKFMKELILLYSTSGDWIFDGLGGIGTTLIAAINATRNCVTVENNSLQYIWAKVRVVKAIGQTISNDKTPDDKENAEMNEETNTSVKLNAGEHDSTDDDEAGNEQSDK